MKNINRPPLEITDPAKPKCPRHMVDMQFDPRQSRWRCTVDGCRVAARHRDDPAEESKPKPKSKEGLSLSITRDTSGEETYLLTYWDGERPYVIDISDHVEMVVDEPSGAVTICLLFNGVDD